VNRRGAFSYRDAGVDLRVAEDLTTRLKELAESTRTGSVEGAFGAFGARFHARGDPVLVSSADGVGTKVMVAARAGVHDTVGEDLVNHCVNDILTEGAEPLFFMDYFACGRLDPDVAAAVVEGIARGCARNGCALLGGETAEMPGLYPPGEFDLAGFIVGRVTFDIPGRGAVEQGNRLIALASSGLHTNGYSLARALLFERLGLEVDDAFPGTSATVGEVLLRVHRSYLPPLRPSCAEGRVRALAHITGGGIPGNLRRVLPSGADAVVDLSSWKPPVEFRLLAAESGLDSADLYETLNMGVGMIAVVSPDEEDRVLESLRAGGCESWSCGEITVGRGTVRLQGRA
jgi:phosphoribosylformylglycinamidine cyclo-ligase